MLDTLGILGCRLLFWVNGKEWLEHKASDSCRVTDSYAYRGSERHLGHGSSAGTKMQRQRFLCGGQNEEDVVTRVALTLCPWLKPPFSWSLLGETRVHGVLLQIANQQLTPVPTLTRAGKGWRVESQRQGLLYLKLVSTLLCNQE